MLDACKNLLWNADERKPELELRRSQPHMFPLLLITLVLLANAVSAVDYQEDWEEADVCVFF